MIQAPRLKARLARGFTLVELLIVVIILAILAAVVIPQFAASTDDAKLASLDTTLANMRSALDLYYQQHGEYPSAKTDGTNAAGTLDAFVNQLSQYTDNEGVVSATKVGNFKYGPYLRRAQVPLEPMTEKSDLKIESAGTLGLTAEGTNPGGWRYDYKTGQYIVNDGTWDDR